MPKSPQAGQSTTPTLQKVFLALKHTFGHLRRDMGARYSSTNVQPIFVPNEEQSILKIEQLSRMLAVKLATAGEGPGECQGVLVGWTWHPCGA